MTINSKYPECHYTQQDIDEWMQGASPETSREDVETMLDNQQRFAAAYPDLFWLQSLDDEHWEPDERFLTWFSQEPAAWEAGADIDALAIAYKALP